MATRPGRIGFIGVGVMGALMAKRLLDRGHALVVHDRDPDAVRRMKRLGAAAAGSPREVADAARVVFASLPMPEVVRAVALGDDGVVRGRAVRTFVDLSTTGSAVEKEVAAGLARRRIQTVDAPISGGAAAIMTLAVMAQALPRAPRWGPGPARRSARYSWSAAARGRPSSSRCSTTCSRPPRSRSRRKRSSRA
jgi:2-hydroxy-3-oxopropionate reductase